jgi:hypothetical protein
MSREVSGRGIAETHVTQEVNMTEVNGKVTRDKALVKVRQMLLILAEVSQPNACVQRKDSAFVFCSCLLRVSVRVPTECFLIFLQDF